jgi:hypothetical protein
MPLFPPITTIKKNEGNHVIYVIYHLLMTLSRVKEGNYFTGHSILNKLG